MTSSRPSVNQANPSGDEGVVTMLQFYQAWEKCGNDVIRCANMFICAGHKVQSSNFRDLDLRHDVVMSDVTCLIRSAHLKLATMLQTDC